MKTLFAALWCAIAATSAAFAADAPVPPAAAAPQQRWFLTISSEVRYFSWQSTRGFPPRGDEEFPGRGSQWYVPYAAQLVGQPTDEWKLEFLGRGGWVKARQTTFGISGEVQTITDTQASA